MLSEISARMNERRHLRLAMENIESRALQKGFEIPDAMLAQKPNLLPRDMGICQVSGHAAAENRGPKIHWMNFTAGTEAPLTTIKRRKEAHGEEDFGVSITEDVIRLNVATNSMR